MPAVTTTTAPPRSGTRLWSLLGAALLAAVALAGPLAAGADAATASVCEPPACRIVLEPLPRPWPWPGPNPCLSCPDGLRLDDAITVINPVQLQQSPVQLQQSAGIRPRT